MFVDTTLPDDVMVCPLPHLLALIDQGLIQATDLVPAYGGESAGLDLYNAGPTLEVHPVLTKGWADSLQLAKDTENSNFEQLPEDVRKLVYKTLMPTGIKVAIPHGYVGLILERGSVVKTPFKVRAGVIDSGYTGEVFVNMINISDRPAIIPAGSKSPFQLVVVPCKNTFHLCGEEVYRETTTTSQRQSGQIGSSDKK